VTGVNRSRKASGGTVYFRANVRPTIQMRKMSADRDAAVFHTDLTRARSMTPPSTTRLNRRLLR